jgi:polyhydroxyalkanoate synthesis regulator phasin
MTSDHAEGPKKSETGGLPDSLRTAVERTLSATGDAAAETAERAQELLDEVARRGQEAREEVARQGQKTREGLSRIRLASADEVRELNERLAGLEARLGEIEVALRASAEPSQAMPKPKVED